MTHSISRAATGLALLLGTFALAFVPPLQTQVGELTEKDQKELGRLLGKYSNGKSDKDKEKAKLEFAGSLEKIGKKKGAKETADAVTLALSMNADLGRALFFAGEYKSSLRGGKPVVEEISAPALAGTKASYTLNLPSSYRAGSAPIPLILCIAGMKDGKPMTATDFLTQELSDATLRDNAAIAVVSMPSAADDWNALKVGDKPLGGMSMVMFTWGDVKSKVSVDAERIYLLARGSESVAAAMHVAARFPHCFAGLVGMAGDASAAVEHTNFINLPTLFVGAGGNATAFESKIKEAGYGNCTLRSDGNVADVWSWMAQTQRVSNPLKVVFKPVDPAHDRAYWLRIPPTEGLTSVISAECDRASNTIKVTAPGVAQVTLMFNGALVDFTKKVNIEINGKSRSESVVPTVEEMLQLSSSSDNGRVYVARRVYDVL